MAYQLICSWNMLGDAGCTHVQHQLMTANVMTTFSKMSDFVYFLPFLLSLYYYPEPSGTFHDDPLTSVVTHTPDRSSMT